MIYDNTFLFSDKQSIATTNTNSTNIVNLTSLSDLGDGEEIFIDVFFNTGLASTSSTLYIIVDGSIDETFSDSESIFRTKTYIASELKTGTHIYIPFIPARVSINYQYIRLFYAPSHANSGIVVTTSCLLNIDKKNKLYPAAATWPEPD